MYDRHLQLNQTKSKVNMNKTKVIRVLGALGSVIAATALFLDGRIVEAGGILSAAFSSPALLSHK